MNSRNPFAAETAGDKARILVVDDHRAARESMSEVLAGAAHDVRCAASAVEALKLVERETFDVIVTDLQMPGMNGLELMQKLSGQSHGAQILMVTAHATVSAAVEAMRHGAFDFIEKPFAAEQLEGLVARALRHRQLEDRSIASPADAAAATSALIGTSAKMRALRGRLSQVARTSETVLIVGESGTGKELVARSIHAQSERRTKPMISLNCPALSAQLMESELFGHERGAFTGADAQRIGRFELADGGTILLDEVTEIELPLQAKLLRVLQEKQFERVGSSETRQADARVLATSNRNLQQEVSAGRFRLDLYYRLAVLPLEVPPLRERREDIKELASHFLATAAARLQRPACELSPSALDVLCSYNWPGNVRELENIITRASVLNGSGTITADELRDWLESVRSESPTRPTEAPSGLSMQDMERRLIETTLEQFDGHRGKTAQALGIGLRTLTGKLRAYGYAPRAKSLSRAG